MLFFHCVAGFNFLIFVEDFDVDVLGDIGLLYSFLMLSLSGFGIRLMLVLQSEFEEVLVLLECLGEFIIEAVCFWTFHLLRCFDYQLYLLTSDWSVQIIYFS